MRGLGPAFLFFKGGGLGMSLADIERNKDGYIVLKRTYSELYKRTQYNTPLDYVQNSICEYDIRAANLTMLTKSKKVDTKTLDVLKGFDRDSREYAVGKMIQQNSEVYTIIAKGILNARHQLFRENLIQDYEVLAVRNDAVFVVGRRLKHTVFGEVEFRLKNRYSLFKRLEGIDFLYDTRRNLIDVKGVSDEVVRHPDHQAGMIKFFATVFRFLCYERRDDLKQYLIKFVHDYKAMALPVQYYREFNSNNVYHTKYESAGFIYDLTEAGESDKDIINPVYNYKRFILPLVWAYL